MRIWSVSGTAGWVAIAMVFAARPGAELVAQDKGEASVTTSDLQTLPVSDEFAAAVERGTRTVDGRPGPNYWQQWATYDIAAELDASTRRLSGEETVWYFNRSPDDLSELYMHLRPNIFSPKAERNTNAPSSGGVSLREVRVNGELATTQVNGTILQIILMAPLVPGDSIRIDAAWSYPVPPNGPRSGFDGEVYFLAYWYPQMAVYDDLRGWNTEQYLGNAEFYMGYGNYRVSLTLPVGFVANATGRLVNPDEVLTETVRERLARARTSRETVNIVGPGEREAGLSTLRSSSGKLTWRFEAENVRDVAWTTSDQFVWDATFALTGYADGDGAPDTTDIYAFYRPRSSEWFQDARWAQHSIEILSRELWPYPYPHMTAAEGPTTCGGMEYPMMTCIGSGQFQNDESLYNVTEHEIGHMWFPMQVGSNENLHAWMDEGLTQFNEIVGMEDLFPSSDVRSGNLASYLMIVRAGAEEPMMVAGDEYENDFAYGIASYSKPATALSSLRRILGEDEFRDALREYGRRWLGRHPAPWDLWNTFDDVTGMDLDWFWRGWFFETWTLDQSIESVERDGDSLRVTVANNDDLVMPVFLDVEFADGTGTRITGSVDAWLRGEHTQVLPVPDADRVASITIDRAGVFPDVDRSNQSWER